MRIGNRNKKAFTLAEIMIVLLVLTIIFAALAPLITKRKSAASTAFKDPWNWADRNTITGPMNAIADANNENSKAFFGITPRNEDNNEYNAKVIIRSGIVNGMTSVWTFRDASNVSMTTKENQPFGQRQLELRYGRNSTSDNGTLTASLYSDNVQNLLFGADFPELQIGRLNNNADMLKNNLAFGYGALNNIRYMVNDKQSGVGEGDNNNIAFGYNALLMDNGHNGRWADRSERYTSKQAGTNSNIGIGANAGGSHMTPDLYAGDVQFTAQRYSQRFLQGNGNIIIGSNAATRFRPNEQNIAIGYNAQVRNNYNISIGQEAAYGNIQETKITCTGEDNEEKQEGFKCNTEKLCLEPEDNNSNNVPRFDNSSANAGCAKFYYTHPVEKRIDNNNVAIGARALHKLYIMEDDNIAIGYSAMNNLQGRQSNQTTHNNIVTFISPSASRYDNYNQNRYGKNNIAIGYKACSNLAVGAQNKTCIGAYSGPKSIGNDVMTGMALDYTERTYIGTGDSNSGGFSSNALIELHNPNPNAIPGGQYTNKALVNNPAVKSNTTTIINANLIVKGNTYFTVGSNLFPFYYAGAYRGTDNNPYRFFGTNLEQCATNQVTYGFQNGGPKCSINISSDRRLKNIKGKNTSGLDEINKLQVYNYKFKNDPNKEPHMGVIAQELQKVFPTAVGTDENGYLKIRWDEMFYACINALKTLNQRIATLVKRTVSLEDDIEKLENENKQLQNDIDNITKRVAKLKAQQE